MIIEQVYQNIVSLLAVTFTTEAIWTIIPLILSTLLMMIYFGIYRNEKSNWSSNFSNSFVLLFVSIQLARYIYGIGGGGVLNFFVYHWPKTLATLFVLAIGLFLIRFNFEHLLPMSWSTYLSSPLTVNSFAYAVILFVYSTEVFNWISALSLLIIILILIGIFILIKIPAEKLSNYIQKQKEKEKVKNLKELTFYISELEKELVSRKKELKDMEINQIERERKEALRLAKIAKKSK